MSRSECALQCRVCQQRDFKFDGLIDHLETKHDINLRKQVRKMEREAKKNSMDSKCRICKKLVPKLEFRVRSLTAAGFLINLSLSGAFQ